MAGLRWVSKSGETVWQGEWDGLEAEERTVDTEFGLGITVSI